MVLLTRGQGIQTSTLVKMALFPSLGPVQLLTLSLAIIKRASNAFWQKVTDLYYCIQHSLTEYSVSGNYHTRSLDQLKNRFKVIKKDMNEFKVHYSHIISESPSGVPQEEYIDLACDQFQAVQKRKFWFK
jgi:hypothetical protein